MLPESPQAGMKVVALSLLLPSNSVHMLPLTNLSFMNLSNCPLKPSKQWHYHFIVALHSINHALNEVFSFLS